MRLHSLALRVCVTTTIVLGAAFCGGWKWSGLT